MRTTVKNIWYNPATSSFEGRIDIQRGGRSFRYPCMVKGPMDMSPADVRRRMQDQAQRMSDTPPSVFSVI